MAISLQPSFITPLIKNRFNWLWKKIDLGDGFVDTTTFLSSLDSILLEDFLKELTSEVTKLRHANMLRHNYIPAPILSFTKYAHDPKNNLLITGYAEIKEKELLELDKRSIKYSPRFVHFHELCLHESLKSIYAEIDIHRAEYLDKAFDCYYEINRHNELNLPETKEDLREQIYVKETPDILSDSVLHVVIKTDQKKARNDITVALGNWKVPQEVYEHRYFLKPYIEPSRRKRMNKLLNEVISVFPKAPDLIVFPENSVPIVWLKWLCDYSQRHQIAMCFGLEHVVVNNKAYNFIATLLPVKLNGFNSLVTVFRLKNHYSPGEAEHLRKFGYEIPQPKQITYNLFEWRNFHFTFFNCFELANISHRASFRSKVDCIIASAYNRDVNYFSNIVESVTRDVHSYFILSNDSHYGDNRVSAPRDSVSKDLIRLKGGTNNTLLVCDLELQKIREFQILEYAGQLADGSFKPTPPDFDRLSILKRLGHLK